MAKSKEDLKQKIDQKIDSYGQFIINTGRQIYNNPELGFKEYKTSKLLEEALIKDGYKIEKNLALTGLKAKTANFNNGPNIAIIGELDAVICPEHPDADPGTGAVHACGHNVQAAVMAGLARVFSDSSLLKNLAGNLSFIAAPAEEYIELSYRKKLKDEGKIVFFGGKQELLRTGIFDNIDIVIMFHLYSNPQGESSMIGKTSNGFIAKYINYYGKEAHAGAEPHLGINALNACMLGMQAIHMQRETFQESDYVRVHPIITKGGDIVNIVPAEVTMETYVRAKRIDSIVSTNKKVDRALRAGALGIGAELDIIDYPGYLPQKNDENLNKVFEDNLLKYISKNEIKKMGHHTGSSDIGDIMHIMPAIHPYIGGAAGNAHSRNFKIADEELAYILSAKVIASTIIDLLYDKASLAKEIIQKFEDNKIYSKNNSLELWKDFV